MDSPKMTEALAETLALFEPGGAPLTTPETADSLGLGRRSTYERLDRLAEGGRLETKRVGASARVWWRPVERGGPTDGAESERAVRRERDLLDAILETSPVGVVVVGVDGEIDRINERGRDLLGIDDEEADTYSPADRTVYDADGELVSPEDHPSARTLATGEPVYDWRCRVELPDGGSRWLSVSAAAVRDDDGDIERVVTTGEDVTRDVERARVLRRERDELRAEMDDALDRVTDGFYGLDDELRFTYLNERAATVLGVDASEAVGRDVRETVDLTDRFEEALREAVDGGEAVSLEDHYDPVDAWFDNAVYPSETGVSVYFRDVTDRKRAEEALRENERRYRLLAENFPNGAVVLLDDELRYLTVGGTVPEGLGLTAAELEGERVTDRLPEDLRAVVEPRYRAALDGEPGEFEVEIAGRVREVRVLPLVDDDGAVTAAMAMSQDVTERRERERRLAESEQRYRKLVEHFPNGMVALFDEDLRYTLVGGEFFEEFDVDPSAYVGERAGSVVADPSIAERLPAAMGAALDGETTTLEMAWGGREWSVKVVPVADDGGTLSAGMLVGRDVTAEREHEREQRRRREQVAALNHLHEVVGDVTDAAIDRSTREEIERVVCERLAASDSYLFAWTGEVDVRTGAVVKRVEAGVEGYLDDATITEDPDDEGSAGPTTGALLDGEIRTRRHLRPDAGEPWSDRVGRYGFRSMAAIPIAHEGTVYGVLNVYADRPDAFAERERAVVGRLGEVVGHAIAAADRKRALLSDEVVELEFRIPDVLESVGIEGANGGRVALEHVVPLDGGEFLVYGRATDGGADTVRAVVEAVPFWREATFRDDGERFELRLAEPPVLSTAASLGGSFEGAVIEDGGYRMTFHLSPSVDAGRLVDVVREAYPTASLVRRRQVTRDADGGGLVRDTLDGALTDRQRAALDAAFHAGFFEWPRAASGQEVASSLGVAPPTFHQHLRTAEAKVFDALLSTPAPS